MLMFITKSHKLVDAIINHPDVRPTIDRGDEHISCRRHIDDSRNLFFVNSYGVVFFKYLAPGFYEVHTGFIKAGRGATAFNSLRSAIESVLADHGGQKIAAAIPLQLRPARIMCRMLGFASTGRDPQQEFFALEGAGYGRID